MSAWYAWACVNSPLNCTLSGPEHPIEAIKAQADEDGIFAQTLKTGVAYHSPAMLAVADEYRSRIGNIGGDDASVRDAKAAGHRGLAPWYRPSQGK